MKYTVTRLDGRYSYHKWFEYYIGFSNHMTNHQGPSHYNDCMKWFFRTYGWSAEIRQYDKISQWVANTYVNTLLNQRQSKNMLIERSEHCNPHWSWSNHYADLRIYVAGEPELAFFQISHSAE